MKRSSTRSTILMQAHKLFSKEGYAATSINDLAKLVKVAKPSIYHFFKDKEDLYCQVVERACTEIEERLREEFAKIVPEEKRMRNFILVYLKYAKVHKIVTDHKIPSSSKRILKIVDTFVEEKILQYFELLVKSQKHVPLSSESDYKLAATLLMKMMNAYVLHDARKKDWTPEKVADIVTNVFFQPNKR